MTIDSSIFHKHTTQVLRYRFPINFAKVPYPINEVSQILISFPRLQGWDRRNWKERVEVWSLKVPYCWKQLSPFLKPWPNKLRGFDGRDWDRIINRFLSWHHLISAWRNPLSQILVRYCLRYENLTGSIEEIFQVWKPQVTLAGTVSLSFCYCWPPAMRIYMT